MNDGDKKMEIMDTDEGDPYSRKEKSGNNKFVPEQLFSTVGLRRRLQNATGLDRFILGGGWYILPYIVGILYAIFIAYTISKGG